MGDRSPCTNILLYNTKYYQSKFRIRAEFCYVWTLLYASYIKKVKWTYLCNCHLKCHPGLKTLYCYTRRFIYLENLKDNDIILFKVFLVEILFIALWLLTLTETDSSSDSDSKPNGYIVLCRTCSHCTDLDSDPFFLFLYRTRIRVRAGTQVRLRHCKLAIRAQFTLSVCFRMRSLLATFPWSHHWNLLSALSSTL